MAKPKLNVKTIGIYLIFLFVLQEVAFRLVFPIPEVSNFDRVKYMELNNHHAEEAYTRNHTWNWQSSLDTNHVYTHYMNLYGFRDHQWEIDKPENKKRIMFFGDSFVEGMMAEQDEKITDYFAQKDSIKAFEIMNAGVGGSGLDAHLQLTADIIPMLKPDIAILCLYANDMGKREPIVPTHFLEPEYYNPYLPRIAEYFKQINYHGSLLPRWGGNERGYFLAVPDSSNPWTRFADLFAKNINKKIGKEMKQAKMNPFLINKFAKEEARLKLPPLLGQTVPFFKYICDQNQTIPVIVYLPSRNQVTKYYYPFEKEMTFGFPTETFDLTQPQYNIHQVELAKQCIRFQVPFMDLTQLVKAEETEGNHLFWNYDQHMKPKGYKLLGEKIFDVLNEAQILK